MRSGGTTIALLAACPLMALADDALPGTSAASENDDLGLPLIVISPEWRPIDAQSVARTVHRFGGESLTAGGTSSTIDLQYETPGFLFKTNSVLGQPYLRGVGSDVITAGAEPSVATFVDGVYHPRAYDSIVDFYDLDRVEVLKGPQGVSLGRNVVGGAISIHSRDPEPYRSAWGEVLYGSYDKRSFRGAVNVPLTPQFAFRLAGNLTRREGYSHNIFLGEDADNENHGGVRGKLRYRPGDEFDLLLTAEYRREDSNRAIAPWPDPVHGVNGGIQMGGIVPPNPRELTSNVRPVIDTDYRRYSLRAGWVLDRHELVSTTALVDSRARLSLDLDGTNADFAANHPSGDSRTLTQEFRLFTRNEPRFNWTLGAFLLDEQARQRLDVRLPQAGIISQPDGRVGSQSWALFGQAGYLLAPRWKIRAGLRYTRDQRKLDLTKTVTSSAGRSESRQQERKSWQATTPEIVLEYSPRKHALYYASYSRGYKAGGFNTSSIQPAFDPEDLRAIELGTKARFLGQRAQLNAALFHYDYRDMQLRTPPPDASGGAYPMVINAARSAILGLDLNGRYQASPRLGLSLDLTLMDARFVDFVSIDPNNPGRDPDRSGKRLPQAPRLSLNAGTEYQWSTNPGRFRLRAHYLYQSDVYFNIYQDEHVRQKSYGLFNASLEFSSRHSGWYAILYGRNLTDRLYRQTVIRADPLTGIKHFWGPPRTLGLTVGYRT
ncbi:MAG TPA: TonB-dependent receptor [Thiotrichales bacterium]|nr:TonB-dependent receptor [Thiotrichales bacterium]